METKQDLPTDEQLVEMARAIRPAICSLLCVPEEGTTISFRCEGAAGGGLSMMRMEVRINGQPITPEQDALIIEMLKKAGAARR